MNLIRYVEQRPGLALRLRLRDVQRLCAAPRGLGLSELKASAPQAAGLSELKASAPQAAGLSELRLQPPNPKP